MELPLFEDLERLVGQENAKIAQSNGGWEVDSPPSAVAVTASSNPSLAVVPVSANLNQGATCRATDVAGAETR